MISCNRCRKEINRDNPRYCYRCGFALLQDGGISAIAHSPMVTRASTSQSVGLQEPIAPRIVASNPVLRNAGLAYQIPGSISTLGAEDLETTGLTLREHFSNEAWMAKCAPSQRSKRRANRRGIATGFLIGIGVLGLFHHIGVRTGMLPFVHFGGPHWISFAQPTTARLWLRESIAALLMIGSPFLPFRFGDLIQGHCHDWYLRQIPQQIPRRCRAISLFLHDDNFCIVYLSGRRGVPGK